jgi:hypothetical protein
MTESEWLKCDDPKMMLMFLHLECKSTERKVRLFGAACLRRIWKLLANDGCRDVVEVTERFADGLVGRKELEAACRRLGSTHLAPADFFSCSEMAYDAVVAATDASANPTNWRAMEAVELALQATFLRDIIGNPFRPPPVPLLFDIAVSLAHAAYDERKQPNGRLDQLRLFVLADALEEAGAAAELIEHLRSEGPHVRGCWVVDSLTSRE